MAPDILIFFSIAMVADYLFDVKNIDIWALAFFNRNISFVDTVYYTFLSSQETKLRLISAFASPKLKPRKKN